MNIIAAAANPMHALFDKILPVFIFVAVGVIAIAIFKAFVLPRLKGKIGEATVNFIAKRRLDPNTYILIPDVTLPAGDATTQIDHVIVSRYGVFVVETKTYKGWIYGSTDQPQWTQVNFGRKDRFQNPLRQNYKHVKTLAELTGIPENFFISVVVFAGDCKFKTEMPPNVVRLGYFADFIKSRTERLIKDEQVPDVASAIREWAGTVSDDLKRQHVANLKKNKAPVSVEAEAPACPRCASPMVLRTRRQGGQFWGCPKYPACRGVREAV